MRLALLASIIALGVPVWADDEAQLLEPLRTVQLAGGERVQVSFEELLDLKRAGIGFFDVTGHDEVAVAGSAFAAPQFPSNVSRQEDFEDTVPLLSKERLESTLRRFSSFFSRYARSDSGVASGDWLYAQLVEIVQNRSDITISRFHHEWPQDSLIVSIKGTKNPEKIVIVGAHQDSINLILPSIMPAPGADDDGSGAMTTLEVLRVLLSTGFKPENTVEFHWYAAEELGCLGSLDVFRNYSLSEINVRAMLQQDMTGFSAYSKKNAGHDELGLITDYVDPKLTEYIKVLVDAYCTIPYVETECGYACSDHASASEYGYASAFVIESDFSNIDNMIHTTEDTVDKLDFDHMIEHARLTLGFALELAVADV